MAVRYRGDDGRPLISVTQVLTLAGRINSEWFTEEAAAGGTAVHTLTEQYDRDGENVQCPAALAGYLNAYIAFLAQVRPVYVATEVTARNARLGLGGRIDRVCTAMFGSPGLIDFKTSEPYPWHGQQLAAYNVLHPTGARWGVYLGATGRFRVKQYDDPADHRRFMFDLATTRGTVTSDGDNWITVI